MCPCVCEGGYGGEARSWYKPDPIFKLQRLECLPSYFEPCHQLLLCFVKPQNCSNFALHCSGVVLHLTLGINFLTPNEVLYMCGQFREYPSHGQSP